MPFAHAAATERGALVVWSGKRAFDMVCLQ